jgi:hypothetical protein
MFLGSIMALYKYVSTDVLKRILNGSIRLTQPGAFNDPFEMLPELHIPDDFVCGDINLCFDILSPRRQGTDQELNDMPPERFDDVNSRKIRAVLNQSIGILCLSKNPSSLLMWSHYADQYAGAVVEFDDEHAFFQGQIDVEYAQYRPKQHINAYIGEGQVIPISELCVKPKEWEYESEVRIIRNLADCKKISDDAIFPVYVLDLPQECIKSVTIGERTPIPTQREIFSLVKDTRIALSLAAISNQGYEFRNELVKFGVPVSEVGPWLSPRIGHIFTERNTALGDVARYLVDNHAMSKAVNDIV